MKLNALDTEKINQNSLHIDEMNTLDILKTINDEDQKVALAVKEVLPSIAKAVDCIYERIRTGGRLIYIGAGTSGRLGILDASECPPTYGVKPTLVQGLIAGGEKAITTAVEGAEDSLELAIQDLQSVRLTKNDVVCGIAASGRTPYVIGGLKYARDNGCSTISICCSNNGEISMYADYPIEVIVGPEVIAGSTRMKSGTAQKMILNMLTTSVMVKIGKVYKNLMVDVQPTNKKLRVRAINIIHQAIGVTEDEAHRLLEDAHYDVKVAIMMGITNLNEQQCLELLNDADGNISRVIHNFKEL